FSLSNSSAPYSLIKESGSCPSGKIRSLTFNSLCPERTSSRRRAVSFCPPSSPSRQRTKSKTWSLLRRLTCSAVSAVPPIAHEFQIPCSCAVTTSPCPSKIYRGRDSLECLSTYSCKPYSLSPLRKISNLVPLLLKF